MGSGRIRADAACQPTQLRRRLLRWSLRSVALAFLVGLLLVIVFPEVVLPPVASFLDVSEPPRPMDYVLILNGDPDSRPFAAAALVRTGLAQKVLLTRQSISLESDRVKEGTTPSEHALTKQVLRARGVPEDIIRVLPGEVSSTFDEALALTRLLDEEPGATVGVVTNSFHTRRARWVFRQVLGKHTGQVLFLGIPRDRIDPDAWWKTGPGCVAYMSEYGKLLFYVARYAGNQR